MIEKFLEIRNVGRFTGYKPQGDVAFKKLTLVYGENGHGKTTLAAILRSLRLGNPAFVAERATLGAKDPYFVQIRAAGQNFRLDQSGWSAALSGIEVFDTHYITENVYTGDHVDPEHRKRLYDVVVGTTAVTLARNIDDIDSGSRKAAADVTSAEEKLKEQIQSPFGIDEFLQLRPEKDLDEKIKDVTTRLSASRRSSEVVAKPSLVTLSAPQLPLRGLQALQRSLQSVAAQAQERVRAHLQKLGGAAENWVRQGLDYADHQEDCPFCEQKLAGVEMLDLYRVYFTNSYDEYVVELRQAQNELDQQLGPAAWARLVGLAKNNEAAIAAWTDLLDLSAAKVGLDRLEGAWTTLRDLLKDRLAQRLKNPSDRPPASDPEVDAARRDYEEARNELEKANVQVGKANEAVAAKKKDAAATDPAKLEAELRRLRNMQIRQQPEVDELCVALMTARSRRRELESKRKEAKTALEQASQALLQQYESAINDLLSKFGASFRLSGTKVAYPGGKANSVYKISLNGQEVDLGDSRTPVGTPCFRSVLSAGDKSTLALAFFLASVGRDQTLSSKAVVVDDPLSSLDSFRHSVTQNEIVSLGRRAAQVIVFSHDAFFLKRLGDAAKDMETKVLKLKSGANHGLVPFDLDQYCREPLQQDYFLLRTFLDDGAPTGADLRGIATKIRPFVEGHLRIRFPAEINDREMLGEAIERIKAAPAQSPLAALKPRVPQLQQINSYSAPYHHSNVGQAIQPAPSETELQTQVKLALDFVQGT